MNQVELQSSLSKRSIGASALSFFKSGQWAKQADEQRWQPCQYLCKVLDPSGLDQDMIHDDVVADLGEFGDRSMEAADEPIAYDGHLDGDSIDRHALQPGRPNVLIEVRNDLIADENGQTLWASRLAPILQDVLAATGL